MVCSLLSWVWYFICLFTGIYDHPPVINEDYIEWWIDNGILMVEPKPIIRNTLTGIGVILQLLRMYYCF